MKRRDFLETSTKLFCACAAGTGLSLIQSCTNNVATSPSVEQDSEELIIDLSSEGFTTLLNEGGSITTDGNVIDSQGLLLIRSSEDNIKAFSRRCTHSSYSVNAFNSQGLAVCSSGHGGSFNTSGNVAAGPPSARLTSYSTSLTDSILIISK